MARKYISNGKVYLEDSERKVIVNGKILLETTAVAPTGGDLLLTNRSIANYQGIRQ